MKCPICGGDFARKHPAQRTCSAECKRAMKREYARKRRAADPARVKMLQAEWTERNREHVNAKMRERRAENPAYAEKQRVWRRRNAERLREYDRKRRARKKERAEVVAIVGEIVELLFPLS